MPAQKQKSSLAARLGSKLQKAHEAHKDDEITLSGGGTLPDGIEHGIAKLVDCRFDVYKSGKYVGKDYFFAAGVVVEPGTVGNIPVKGLRTQIILPACETMRANGEVVSFDTNWARIENALRKLGVPTSKLGADDVETAVAALTIDPDSPTYFRFRTWKGKKKVKGTPGYNEQYDGPSAPEPRVNEDWGMYCEYIPDEESGGIADDTPEEATQETAPKAGGKKPPAKPPVVEEVEEEPDAEEQAIENDLAALAEAADNNDEEAQTKINELALEAGITQKKINAADNWTAVVALFAPAKEEDAEKEEVEEAVAEDDWRPEVGEVYGFKPMGKKKAIDHEVLAVSTDKRTVNLKSCEDGKTIVKGVSWDKLEQA